MARPLPADYLQPGEATLVSARRHPLAIVDGLLVVLVVWLLVVVGVTFLARLRLPDLVQTLLVATALLATGIAAMVTVALLWRHQTTLYTVTPERVYHAYGRFRFFLLQTTYDKITDLHMRQSLFGRMFGFGTVTLQTAGTGLALNGVRDPVALKQRIETARTRFLDALIGEYRAQQGTEAAAVPAQEDATQPPGWVPRGDAMLWRGGPTIASFLGNFVALVFFAIAFFGFLGAGPWRDSGFPASLPAALFGLVFVMVGGSAWVQYHYTRYEVQRWGVVVTSGWLSRRRVETTYDKVTDVSTQQTLLGRILGYGTITINTAGSNEAPVVFRGLARPEHAKAIIDEARRARRRRA